MGDATSIEWADATWNPVVGCSIKSPACTNCYAMRMAARLEAMSVAHERDHGGDPGPMAHYRGTTRPSRGGPVWTGKLALAPESTLLKPLRWKRPRRIFVNAMSDLFHEDMPEDWIDAVFDIMGRARQHTFIVLTKRAIRMRAYCRSRFAIRGVFEPNVWLGVTAEDQERADERIPVLISTPAAKRIVSCEPLLGPIDLGALRKIDQIIVGGESGAGARFMPPEWAADLRDQCKRAGVAFFMKQMTRKAVPPPDLLIREFPAQ
jgi:protein gp37